MNPDSDNPNEPDPGQIMKVELHPGNHRVIENPPIPFTPDDLRAALRLKEAALVAQLEAPGGYWDPDTVMLVALLSPDHARRAASYLHMAPAMLDRKLIPLRERLRTG